MIGQILVLKPPRLAAPPRTRPQRPYEFSRGWLAVLPLPIPMVERILSALSYNRNVLVLQQSAPGGRGGRVFRRVKNAWPPAGVVHSLR